MAKANIARMVWPEVQEAVAAGAVVLVPMASIEPVGRHSIMGGEMSMTEYLAEQVAVRTGSVRLPTLPFGYAPSFMGFPGTVSLQAATLTAVLEDVCVSMLHHGFDHILFVNLHRPNDAIIEQAARKIRAERGFLLANLPLAAVINDVARDLFPVFAQVEGHGGEPGISIEHFLHPEDLRMDLAVTTEVKAYHGVEVSVTARGPGAWGTTIPLGRSSWILYLTYADVNPSAGLGDPFHADPEKGRLVMERMIEHGVQVVEAFRKVPTRSK